MTKLVWKCIILGVISYSSTYARPVFNGGCSMPIVICPKCKKRFNDIATYCPSCGYPTKKAKALAKAMTYLKSSAYSYRGLKKQLEDCGYTESQAQYGAHLCGANWYEQAIKSAKMHLKSEPFSYDGLYDQLFTQ